jgi:hypothetical protein
VWVDVKNNYLLRNLKNRVFGTRTRETRFEKQSQKNPKKLQDVGNFKRKFSKKKSAQSDVPRALTRQKNLPHSP